MHGHCVVMWVPDTHVKSPYRPVVQRVAASDFGLAGSYRGGIWGGLGFQGHPTDHTKVFRRSLSRFCHTRHQKLVFSTFLTFLGN